MRLLKYTIKIVSQVYFIRRGLRALGDRKFPMPSNTTRIARTHKELSADVVETVPPWEKKFNFFGGDHYYPDSNG